MQTQSPIDVTRDDGLPLGTAAVGFESFSWLFTCDNRNRGIIRQNFDEAALLWRAVQRTKGPILEIGRARGGSTVLLLAASCDRRVTSIDINPQHHPSAESYFEKVEVSQPGRLSLLKRDSREELSSGSEFGMLVIDGDHTYEGVRADVTVHWGTLRSHGAPPLVVLHDAVPNAGLSYQERHNHCEGVRRLCAELVAHGSAVLCDSAGSSAVLRKTGDIPEAWSRQRKQGHMNSREDVVLMARPGGIGIELGVAEGVFSERILKRGTLSYLYSVDRYAGDRGHDDEQYKRACIRLSPFRGFNSIIKLRFKDALDLFPNEYFDFIYIDGYAHNGEENGETLHDWYKKLRKGGILSGDDYCSEWPLVKRVVDDFIRENKLKLGVIECREPVDYCKYPTWYTRKPENF